MKNYLEQKNEMEALLDDLSRQAEELAESSLDKETIKFQRELRHRGIRGIVALPLINEFRRSMGLTLELDAQMKRIAQACNQTKERLCYAASALSGIQSSPSQGSQPDYRSPKVQRQQMLGSLRHNVGRMP